MASSTPGGRILLNEVNGFITCSLCNGYLTDATTLANCLHSFCRSCIRRHLASTGQCPRCESYANDVITLTKPRMRRDRTLQRMVYKMVPGLLQNELSRRQAFAAYREQTRSMTSSAGCDTSVVRSEDGSELASYQVYTARETYNIRLDKLQIDDHEPEQERNNAKVLAGRYLLCPGLLTVCLLKKFIRLKFDLVPSHEVNLFVCGEVITENYTLTDLAYIFKLRNDEAMTFHYSFETSSPSRYQDVINSAAGCLATADVVERSSTMEGPVCDVMSETNAAKSSSQQSAASANDVTQEPHQPVLVVRRKRGRPFKVRRPSQTNVQTAVVTMATTTPSNSDQQEVIVKRKRGRPRIRNIVTPQTAAPSQVADTPGDTEMDGLAAEVQQTTGNVDDDVIIIPDCPPETETSEIASSVQNGAELMRDSAGGDSKGEEDGEVAEKQTRKDDSQPVWKTSSSAQPEVDRVPRLKMASVKVSRDNSAAAKWLIRPQRDVRKRGVGESGRKQRSQDRNDRRNDRRGQAVQEQGSVILSHHRTEAPLSQQRVNNWLPKSLCSAMVNWNASASAQSMTSAQLPPGMLNNGMSRLPAMFNYGQHLPPSSGVTVNKDGSEVMFVVGADRNRVAAMPSMKTGDATQMDQSLGGLLGGETGVLLPPQSRSIDFTVAGRVATVRPLEHAKLTSQIRVNHPDGKRSIVLDRNGDSVVLVSTIPPDYVFAESLAKELNGFQTRPPMTSSTAGLQLVSKAVTIPGASVAPSPDRRSDDCFEITSTVTDDAWVMSNSPQPPPQQQAPCLEQQHQTTADDNSTLTPTMTGIHSDEKNIENDRQQLLFPRNDSEDSSNSSASTLASSSALETASSATTTSTSSAEAKLSSESHLVQNNSLLNRQKPKKSLETVISLLKRPVSSDSPTLSMDVVDRLLSSTASQTDPRTHLLHTGTAEVTGPTPVSPHRSSGQQQQQPAMMVMTSQSQLGGPPRLVPTMTSSGVQQNYFNNPRRRLSTNKLAVAPPVGDLSPSIKRLRNMCNNMAAPPSSRHVTPWQPEVDAASAVQRAGWTSFYRHPSPLNGGGTWMAPAERFRHDVAAPLELTTPRDRKQFPTMTSLNETLHSGRFAGASTGYPLSTAAQQQFTSGGWRL